LERFKWGGTIKMGEAEVTILFGERKNKIQTELEFLKSIRYIGMLDVMRIKIEDRIRKLEK